MSTTRSLKKVSWLIKNYAYKVLHDHSQCDVEHVNMNEWNYISAKDVPLLLQVDAKKLILYAGKSHVLESFDLSWATHNVTAEVDYRNTNRITMTANYKNKYRQFRLEFSGNDKTNEEECCHQCTRILRRNISIRRTSTDSRTSQVQKKMASSAETYFTMNTSTAADIESGIELAEKSDIHFNSALQNTIKKCLLDPNFPEFVNTVEQHMKILAKSK